MEAGNNDIGNQYLPPLYQGRTFHCYRDINKAIERHREIYGLRLALKRAVKLENYSLTVEKMKDLNLRLKYGELDYHCFVATGRPGRPGNDERCPQLVRLKLSSDAQSLIVYEAHNHNITPQCERQVVSGVPPIKQIVDMPLSNQSFCLKGDITVTPILSEDFQNQKSPVSVVQRVSQITNENKPLIVSPSTSSYIINSKNSFTSLVPVTTISAPTSNLHMKNEFEQNSITITPTITTPTLSQNLNDLSADNPEKITLTIKKSECVPNEMVVVGSLRHVEEQKKSISPNETPIRKPLQLQKNNFSNSGVSSTIQNTTANALKSPVSIKRFVSPVNIAPKPISYPKSESPKIISSCSQKVMSNTKVTSSFTNSKNVVKPMNSKIQPIAPAPTKPVSITKQSETNNTSQSKENPAVKLPIPLSTNPSVPSNSTDETKAIIKQSPQLKQVTVLKQSSNMKQVIINKHSPKSTLVKSMTNKPTITDKSPGIRHGSPVENSSPTIRPILPKIIENSRIINTNSPTSMKPNCTSDPIVPISAANTDPLINKSTDKCIEGNPIKPNVVKYKDGSKILLQKSSTNPALNNSSLAPRRPSDIQKKFKKKSGRPRPPDNSNFKYRSSGSLVDTELGYNEKQHLAHGVLLQLLRVTSQLPMVEFSHALETLEVLTDAFRLNQRVCLSIKHDEEDLCSNGYGFINGIVKSDEKDYGVSSTTDDDKLALSQIDGQLDHFSLLKELASGQEVSLGYGEVEPNPELENMEVDFQYEEAGHLRDFPPENILNSMKPIVNSTSNAISYDRKTLKRSHSINNLNSEFPISKRKKQ